jgi:adenylate cyclase
MVASAAAGGLYSVVRAPPDFNWVIEVATGATIGGVISFCIIGFELFGAAPLLERGGRRLPVLAAVLLRTIVYGVVIMVALLIFPWVYSGRHPSPFRPGIVGDIVFSIAASFVFVSLMSVAQLIGPNMLGRLLTGRYYYPREEQRIVLFLDLVDSTSIAERIGSVRFHAMLSETFTRLSRVVADFGGEVYRYVGDAMIATWPLDAPEENAQAIRCTFACRDALDGAAAHLMERHGHTPTFRAGVHAGPLVAGEIGGFKREIAFVGDTMNTAARIEQACRTTGHALLASKPLLDRTVKPVNIVATSIGGHLLRGKSEYIELFALERNTMDRVESHARGASTFAEADSADAGARVSGAQAISPSTGTDQPTRYSTRRPHP